MERASRLIVLASTGAVFLTYVWLLDWIPGARPWALLLCAAAAAAARLRPGAASVALTGAAFVVPGLLPLITGTTDYHALILWMAPAAGVVLARADPRVWSVPRVWVWPLAAWALVLALTWPIVVGRELDFSLVAAATLDTPNGVSAPAPRLTAAWITHSVLAQLTGLLWFDLLWRRYGTRTTDAAERHVVRPLVAGAAIGALVAIYQGIVDVSVLSAGIWPNLRRATGLMLDANAFAMSAALCAPLAVAAAWGTPWRAWAAPALWMVLAAGSWFAGSRTALVVLVAGSVAAGVALAQRRGVWRPWFGMAGTLVAACVVVAALALAPRGGNSPSPLQRVFDRLPTPDATSMARFADEMWDRFGYGTAAADMLREHLATGVGVASFHVLAPDYVARRHARIVPGDNAQNWWRHQLAELGVVGAVAPFVCSLLLLQIVWAPRPAGYDGQRALIVRGILVGLGLASLVGVPVQHPAIWILAATLVFWATVTAPRASPATGRVPAAAAWAVVFLAAGISVAGQAASAAHDLRVPVRAQQVPFQYIYGLSPAPTPLYPDASQAARHAVAVIGAPLRWLTLTLWAPDATEEVPVRVTATVNGIPVIEATLGDGEPITRYVEVTPGTFARIELSREDAPGGAGLMVVHRWRGEPPADAAAAGAAR